MPSLEETIKCLMQGATPERSDEINELWIKYHPKVVIAKDRAGITLSATKNQIEFDLKTLDVFWLIGFSGWRAIECYTPHVVCSKASKKNLEVLFAEDRELPEIERSYKERLAAARRLIQEDDPNLAPWPSDIPRPSSDRNALSDSEHKVAFDLTLIATAFTFLHEFRHVMLDFDSQRPNVRQEEELQADVWAREFMTTKLSGYAVAHDNCYHDVLRKRSMGLAIAALILHEITPQHGGNCDYFSIKTRLVTLLHNTPLPKSDDFWQFTASLLVGIFRQRHIALPILPMAPRALTEKLLELLPD